MSATYAHTTVQIGDGDVIRVPEPTRPDDVARVDVDVPRTGASGLTLWISRSALGRLRRALDEAEAMLVPAAVEFPDPLIALGLTEEDALPALPATEQRAPGVDDERAPDVPLPGHPTMAGAGYDCTCGECRVEVDAADVEVTR